MALCRRSLIAQALRNVLASSKPAIASPSELQSKPPGRSFSSLLTKWQEIRVNSFGHSQIFEAFSAHHHHPPPHHHHPHQSSEAFSVQHVRHVYVEVIDNDLDSAIKVYKRKMNNAKIEDKLKEKRYYSKPSERRKLAKHYKKLNRARRELGAKIRTVKHRMEKIAEVRKLEKEERKAKATAAAAEAKSSQSSG